METRITLTRSAITLGVAAVGMAWLTWLGWADPLVDFGREAYVPWRLTEGDRLYRDIAWFNGPLSPTLNAFAFRVVGPGLIVLAAANAVVLAATVALMFYLVRAFAGKTAALAGTLIFILVFAMGQYVGIGAYNWIAPYSHELTHGTALGLAAVAALVMWCRTERGALLVVSGAALGLAIMTKPEPVVAALSACAVLFVEPARRGHIRPLVVWAGSVVPPLLIASAVFGPQGTLGAWVSGRSTAVAQLDFYRSLAGVDDLALRLSEILAWGGIWALVAVAVVAGAWLLREGTSGAVGPVSFIVVLGALATTVDSRAWLEALRPLQVAVAFFTAARLTDRIRMRRSRPPGAPRPAPPVGIAFGVFSLALLAKVFFAVRVGHYGFVLAAPAAVFVTAELVSGFPAWLDRRGLRGDVARGAFAGILVVFSAAHIMTTAEWMSRKTEIVGSGRDAFRADIRGAGVRAAVRHVVDRRYQSLAIVPEGVMVNYLARTPTPTRFVNFMPPEEILFGGGEWVSAFDANPPEAILHIPKNTSEYGRGPFGIGYGVELGKWIRTRYEHEGVLDSNSGPKGVLAFENYGFEVRVLRLREALR